MSTELFFFSFAILTTLGAVAAITLRNPIYAILALAFSFISQAGIYLLLSAQFVAVVQIILYTGAIVVLFLFTVMLLNLQSLPKLKLNVSQIGGYGVSVLFFVIAAMAVLKTQFTTLPGTLPFPTEANDIQNLGQLLMGHYALVFEIVSVLLLVSMMAVAIFAKKTEKVSS